MKGDIIKYVSFYDATLNDSSKSINALVPEIGNGHPWQLLFAHVVLTSSAAVGNRLMSISLQDADSNVIMDIHAGSLQAASLAYHYELMQGVYRESINTTAVPTGIDGTIQMPIAQDFIVQPGQTLIIEDARAIAAAADDMTVSGTIAVLR